ncbi:tripartite tricarboxylate transporter TctB family protein [Actinophytocola sp.]|uniref:tripartite tricarboxylate transporter TctB family protein n=1 Tax=Actinophytocola sp. TaxID=1872138 RepID=UPI002ED0F818
MSGDGAAESAAGERTAGSPAEAGAAGSVGQARGVAADRRVASVAGEYGVVVGEVSPEAGASERPADEAARPGESPDGFDFDEAVREVEALEHEYRPPTAGAVSNVVTAVAVVVLGVAALFGALSLGFGSARQPGPGLWPLLVSVALAVLGVALLLGFRRTSDAEKFSHSSWLVLAGLATMVVFVAVIEVVGFEIPAVLLCFVWLRFLGREGWRMSVLTSLAVVVGFYLVFVAALAVPIPHLF